MDSYIDEKRLVISIRVRFPAEATLTDQWFAERGWERSDLDEFPYHWVEAFADRITEAIRRKDAAAIRVQTAFLAAQYLAAPLALRDIIGVSYAENIMWNASREEKAWAWEFIAVDMQHLYEQMWAKPTV